MPYSFDIFPHQRAALTFSTTSATFLALTAESPFNLLHTYVFYFPLDVI